MAAMPPAPMRTAQLRTAQLRTTLVMAGLRAAAWRRAPAAGLTGPRPRGRLSHAAASASARGLTWTRKCGPRRPSAVSATTSSGMTWRRTSRSPRPHAAHSTNPAPGTGRWARPGPRTRQPRCSLMAPGAAVTPSVAVRPKAVVTAGHAGGAPGIPAPTKSRVRTRNQQPKTAPRRCRPSPRRSPSRLSSLRLSRSRRHPSRLPSRSRA